MGDGEIVGTEIPLEIESE